MLKIDTVKGTVTIKLKNHVGSIQMGAVQDVVAVLIANGYWVKVVEVDDRNNVELTIMED